MNERQQQYVSKKQEILDGLYISLSPTVRDKVEVTVLPGAGHLTKTVIRPKIETTAQVGGSEQDSPI